QHDYKNAELSRSEDLKIPELQGDVGKHLKTPNDLLHAATGSTSATREEKIRYVNTNMNKIFEKLFLSKNQKDPLFIPPRLNTYKESLGQNKKTYNHITRAYIENIYKIQTFLNQNSRSKNTNNPMKIISHKIYKDITTPAEILYDKIKPIIQVIKIELTREMIIPEKIERQDEIQNIEILEFYARKRIIRITTILNELTTNYLNGNSV
ncbi:hypothetical protein H5410_021771, partial [Solanum commersonii]